MLVLGTNTMHIVAPAIEAAVSIPLLHLGDVTARAVRDAGLDWVGMLGTRFTMQQSFIRERIAAHGLEVLVPDDDGQAVVHRVIYDELVLGTVSDASRAVYLAIIERLVEQHHLAAPLFATTRLHAEAAVEWMLAP